MPMAPFPVIPEQPPWRKALGMVAGAACAYHGFKRNESAGWAVAWAAFGSGAPFLALPIALAQGFGRREMKVSPDEAHAFTLYQLGALDGVARACGVRVAHVKPHGALMAEKYHRLVVEDLL